MVYLQERSKGTKGTVRGNTYFVILFIRRVVEKDLT